MAERAGSRSKWDACFGYVCRNRAGAEFQPLHPGGSDYDEQLRSRTDTEEVVFDGCKTLFKSTDHLSRFSGLLDRPAPFPTAETEKHHLHVCI